MAHGPLVFKNWDTDTQMIDRVPYVFLISGVTNLLFNAKNMS